MKIAVTFTFMLLALFRLNAQYYEDWSDPVALTDSLSYNSNPEVLYLGYSTYMFYEKQFTEDGPKSIYYRDIQNMGSEIPLLTDPEHTFRNPCILEFFYPDPGYCLLYESNVSGNFDIYALRFDDILNFESSVQLTYSAIDENNSSHFQNYGFTSWDSNGDIYAARLVHSADTLYLDNVNMIDSTGCLEPECCGNRIVYRKMQGDSAALFYSDWNFSQWVWSDPAAMDTMGNNSYCSCDKNEWFFASNDCIVYEKEGSIFSFFYDELHELVLPGYEDEMHEPNYAFYDLPVENLPGPLFITFSSEAGGNKDVYVYWVLVGDSPENVSNDTLPDSNPRFSWGWYASAPCSRYFLDIWEREKNGYQSLYMSKCALYVCGSTEENTLEGDQLEIFPNPFHDELTIRYYANSNEIITLDIRDSGGRIIARMHEHPNGPGWNEVVYIPGEDIVHGPLYLTVILGNTRLFRKVIYN